MTTILNNGNYVFCTVIDRIKIERKIVIYVLFQHNQKQKKRNINIIDIALQNVNRKLNYFSEL